MSRVRLRAGLWAACALAAVAVCALRLAGGAPLETNLLALLPPTERNPRAEQAVTVLAEALGNRAVFLVGHGDGTQAARAAREFAANLRASGAFREVRDTIPLPDPAGLAAFYAPYRFALLSDQDRDALEQGRFDPQQRLLRRLSRPFATGVATSPADDPFGLLEDWLAALPWQGMKLMPEGGLLIARTPYSNRPHEALSAQEHGLPPPPFVKGGTGKAAATTATTHVLVMADLPGSSYDAAVQRAALAAMAKAEQTLLKNHPGAGLNRAGAVFFAEAARSSAEREVDWIGGGSLLGIALLLGLVFRSPAPLLLGLLSVGIGIAMAVAVVVTVQGRLHLITLVFGASLAGEAVDYAIQYFAARLAAGPHWEAQSGLRRVRPALTVALATSLLGYGGLTLAGFPAVSQLALFAFVALAAAYCSVLWLLPALLTRPALDATAIRWPGRLLDFWRRHVDRRAARLLPAALLAAALPGWLLLQADDDIRLLIARPPSLVKQEETVRALAGGGGSGRFFLVEGADAEAVLQREEALTARLRGRESAGRLAGPQAVSDFVPSLARQRAQQALLRQALADQAPALLADAGLDDAAVAAWREGLARDAATLTPERWLASPWSVPLRHLWLQGGASLVLPQGDDGSLDLAALAGGLPGVTLVDKAAGVSAMLREYRQKGAGWLPAAGLLVFGVLALRYGPRDGARILLPTALAMGLALAAFGYSGEPVTLFAVMGLMLTLGVGVNYAIFLVEGGQRAAATFTGVLLSAATTLLSFGLLAFSSMPALHQFGLTLLVGIAFAVLLAPLAMTQDRPKPSA